LLNLLFHVYAFFMKDSDRVRQYVSSHYIQPARSRGDSTVAVKAGEVQKAIGLQNRIANVCQALRGNKFLEENRLTLEKVQGPPSGTSTTVTFIYRLGSNTPPPAQQSPVLRILELWGLGKDVFESLGGGEAYLRNERENFYPPGDPRRDW
jgi:5-methylcytosine-specific restriction protein B